MGTGKEQTIPDTWLAGVADNRGDVARDSNPPAIHGELDPRRVKRLMGHAGAPYGLGQMLRDALKAMSALAALVIFPLAYFGTMVRRRRWGLSWMMLAPPVALLFLIVSVDIAKLFLTALD